MHDSCTKCAQRIQINCRLLKILMNMKFENSACYCKSLKSSPLKTMIVYHQN